MPGTDKHQPQPSYLLGRRVRGGILSGIGSVSFLFLKGKAGFEANMAKMLTPIRSWWAQKCLSHYFLIFGMLKCFRIKNKHV